MVSAPSVAAQRLSLRLRAFARRRWMFGFRAQRRRTVGLARRAATDSRAFCLLQIGRTNAARTTRASRIGQAERFGTKRARHGQTRAASGRKTRLARPLRRCVLRGFELDVVRRFALRRQRMRSDFVRRCFMRARSMRRRFVRRCFMRRCGVRLPFVPLDYVQTPAHFRH